MSFKAMNHKETQDWQQTKIPLSGYQWDLNTHCSQRDLNSAISDHFSKLSQYKATAAYFTSFLCALIPNNGYNSRLSWTSWNVRGIKPKTPSHELALKTTRPPLRLSQLNHLFYFFVQFKLIFFIQSFFLKFESNCGDCIWVSRYESRMKNKIAILCSSWTAQWLLSRWLLCDVTILSYLLALMVFCLWGTNAC